MDQPKVGIIICHKDYNQYLEDCLISAAKSDYSNLEIYLADDGSNIEPINILGQYEQHTFPYSGMDVLLRSQGWYRFMDRKLNYISYKKAGGPSRARNRLINNAISDGCEFVSILDADDEIYPTKITKTVKRIMRSPQAICLCYADYYIHDVQYGTTTYEVKQPYNFFDFNGGFDMIHSGATINCHFLKMCGPEYYPEDMRTCEDYYLYKKLITKGSIPVHLGEPLTLVRNHSQNSTNTVPKEIWEKNFRRVMEYNG